ncbi:MAG: FAD:protein FMN transferase [Nocardiaceae bacterium]|nr:FAD:protein FMN transferase [Nocardiaceae bacterium]
MTNSLAEPLTVSAERGRVMGGSASFAVVGASETGGASCLAQAADLDRLWSRFRQDSDISALNHSAGQPTSVEPRTVRLIREMIAAHERTSGDFDPTLLPSLVERGYDASRLDPELRTTLAAGTRPSAPLSEISIEGSIVTLPPGMSLDGGGIGKGLAADLIVQRAMSAGAAGAMAEIGGDIVVAGCAPDGQAWRIGVEDPFNSGSHVDVVRLNDGAIATSSRLKRRWTVAEGTVVHHLTDPRSLRSAATPAVAVTVIASTGAVAESLTKSGFLRPLDAFFDLLAAEGAAGLVISEDGTAHRSTMWETYS